MINYLYQMKSRNIPDKTSTLDYINNRFSEEKQGLYLSDKFIDEYKETATYNGIMPSSIKVLRIAKNKVATVNFKQYPVW